MILVKLHTSVYLETVILGLVRAKWLKPLDSVHDLYAVTITQFDDHFRH